MTLFLNNLFLRLSILYQKPKTSGECFISKKKSVLPVSTFSDTNPIRSAGKTAVLVCVLIYVYSQVTEVGQVVSICCSMLLVAGTFEQLSH